MEENAKASSMLLRCASRLRCLMKYNPTQSAIAHNPFRSALRAGKNIQRPAKSAEAWCTYSSHRRNDTARPLTTMIAPTTGRGLISVCSMPTIKSQNSIRKSNGARRKGGNMTSECAVTREQSSKVRNAFALCQDPYPPGTANYGASQRPRCGLGSPVPMARVLAVNTSPPGHCGERLSLMKWKYHENHKIG